MDDDATFRIEAVDVEVVRPSRRRLLRPHQPPQAVVYESDAHPSARHFAARDAQGEVVGVGSMHFEDRVAGIEPFGMPGMRIRGMAVEAEWQGRGVGAGLLDCLLQVGQEAGIQEVWANARSMNMGFYERAGFRRMSAEFDLPGLGAHVVMARPIELKKRWRRRKAGSDAAADEAAVEDETAAGGEPLEGPDDEAAGA